MLVKQLVLSSLVAFGLVGSILAQPGRDDPDFLKKSPAVGEQFPELTVYTADGKEFKTSELKGSYSVIAFGCLT